ASAMNAIGRNKALVFISIVRVSLCVILNWLLIGYCQQRFGNGAIAIVIIAGVAEIPAAGVLFWLLASGGIGLNTTFNLARCYVASLCTAIPLSMLPSLGLLYLVPLFALLFTAAAMITRLVLPTDLRLALNVIRTRMLTPEATKAAP